MDYILSGDPKEVQKVIRENRLRCERGVIVFTPFHSEDEITAPATEEPIDEKGPIEPIDEKEPIGAEDTKAPKTTKRNKKSE